MSSAKTLSFYFAGLGPVTCLVLLSSLSSPLFCTFYFILVLNAGQAGLLTYTP